MRKFKNLDGAVFQNERGLLTSNAFEVLNHTLSKNMAVANCSKKPLIW